MVARRRAVICGQAAACGHGRAAHALYGRVGRTKEQRTLTGLIRKSGCSEAMKLMRAIVQSKLGAYLSVLASIAGLLLPPMAYLGQVRSVGLWYAFLLPMLVVFVLFAVASNARAAAKQLARHGIKLGTHRLVYALLPIIMFFASYLSMPYFDYVRFYFLKSSVEAEISEMRSSNQSGPPYILVWDESGWAGSSLSRYLVNDETGTLRRYVLPGESPTLEAIQKMPIFLRNLLNTSCHLSVKDLVPDYYILTHAC